MVPDAILRLEWALGAGFVSAGATQVGGVAMPGRSRVPRVFAESEVFSQLIVDEGRGEASARPLVLDPKTPVLPPVRVLSLKVAHRGLDPDALESLRSLPPGPITIEVPPIIDISAAKLLEFATEVDRDIIVQRVR
jgi:hypothetical protein